MGKCEYYRQYSAKVSVVVAPHVQVKLVSSESMLQFDTCGLLLDPTFSMTTMSLVGKPPIRPPRASPEGAAFRHWASGTELSPEVLLADAYRGFWILPRNPGGP